MPQRALVARCRTLRAAARIVLTRAGDNLDDLLGALGRDVYPKGYLQELRGEWA